MACCLISSRGGVEGDTASHTVRTEDSELKPAGRLVCTTALRANIKCCQLGVVTGSASWLSIPVQTRVLCCDSLRFPLLLAFVTFEVLSANKSNESKRYATVFVMQTKFLKANKV